MDDDGRLVTAYPKTDDVYEEIYLNRDGLERLVDPDLLGAGYEPESPFAESPWTLFKDNVEDAKDFHAGIGMRKHDSTYLVYGTGTQHRTFDRVRFEVDEPGWIDRNVLGRTEDRMKIKSASGSGDGTVPAFSSAYFERDLPAEQVLAAGGIKHQPALNDGGVRNFIVAAIETLAEAWRVERLKASG